MGFEGSGEQTTKDQRQRTTTRNLRIREDTAKYLLNLDVNSSYYDPKSRSMRENPMLGMPESEQRRDISGFMFRRVFTIFIGFSELLGDSCLGVIFIIKKKSKKSFPPIPKNFSFPPIQITSAEIISSVSLVKRKRF